MNLQVFQKEISMTKLYLWSRRFAAVATTGVVFQTTGCAIDSQELAATLIGTLIQNLVATFVFGAFNLVP